MAWIGDKIRNESTVSGVHGKTYRVLMIDPDGDYWGFMWCGWIRHRDSELVSRGFIYKAAHAIPHVLPYSSLGMLLGCAARYVYRSTSAEDSRIMHEFMLSLANDPAVHKAIVALIIAMCGVVAWGATGAVAKATGTTNLMSPSKRREIRESLERLSSQQALTLRNMEWEEEDRKRRIRQQDEDRTREQREADEDRAWEIAQRSAAAEKERLSQVLDLVKQQVAPALTLAQASARIEPIPMNIGTISTDGARPQRKPYVGEWVIVERNNVGGTQAYSTSVKLAPGDRIHVKRIDGDDMVYMSTDKEVKFPLADVRLC